MKIINPKILLFSMILACITLFLPTSINAQEANLLENGTFENPTSDGKSPSGWLSNSWGTNQSKFTYPVEGVNGGKAAQVEITSHSNGDGKWYFNDVPVEAGQEYTFSDQYLSSVPTELVARYQSTSGSYSYVYLAAVPASSTWSSISTNFTIPNDVVSMTIFHLIEQVGSLTIDNVSLTSNSVTQPPEDPPPDDPPSDDPPPDDPPPDDPPPDDPPPDDPPPDDPPPDDPPPDDPPPDDPPPDDPPPDDPPPQETENLIQNSDLESGTGTAPNSWNNNSWGSNQAVFTYPVTGVDGSKGAKVQITSYSSGDSKWYFNDVVVTPGEKYVFTDKYQSTTPTELVVRYTLSNGNYNYVYLGYVPQSSAWTDTSVTFTVPAGVSSLTIFHLIAQVGSLTIDDASLIQISPQTDPPSSGTGMVTLSFDDGWLSTYQNAIPILNSAGIKSTHGIITGYRDYSGYMNDQQILDLYSQGHEINAHSRTHPHLPGMSQTQMRNEITGSYNDLLSLGITNVGTFTYPYGEYNSTTNLIVKESYIAALSTNDGYNDASSDPYLLKRKTIIDTTSVTEINSWIDDAVSQGQWVILMFHKVENNGGTWSTTPDDLQEIVDHIVANDVKTVTIAEGLNDLGML